MMRAPSTPALPPDIHPLRLLASSIVGRPVTIAHLAKEGLPAHTDGERILVPHGADPDELRRQVIIQGLLLNRDTLNLQAMRAIVGRHDLCSRYLVLEVERRCRSVGDRLPRPLLDRLAPFRVDAPLGTALDSLAVARSLRRLPAPPSWYGRLQPWKLLKAGIRGGGGPFDQGKLASLDERNPPPGAEEDEEDDDTLIRTAFWKYLSSPFGKDNALSRFLRDLLDMASSPDKDAADSGLEGSSEMVSSRMSRQLRDITHSIRSAKTILMPSNPAVVGAGAHLYPEWDDMAGRYREGWTSVEEVDPYHAEDRAEDRMDASVFTRGDRAYRNALAGLCLGFERHRREPQGEDLVLDRLIRLAVDLRTGHGGDHGGTPRIYAAMRRTRRDLAVNILLDVSSSTLETNGKGERVFDLQAAVAWTLCRALTDLGDRVALHGFHSWGRRLVRVPVLKGFDEPLGLHARRRMARIPPAGYTRCGAAIRHGAAQLEAQAGTPFKLLLLISDGYPYDDQYEGSYAAADTRKAMEELQGRGIACVCLSVGGDADAERLRSVYGAANHLAVNDPGDIPPRLRRLIERGLSAASR